MKSLSLLGATLVDEAEAVAIINYCLFGAEALRPATPTRPKLAKRPKKNPPRKVPTVPTKCPLDDIVLRKHVARYRVPRLRRKRKPRYEAGVGESSVLSMQYTEQKDFRDERGWATANVRGWVGV